MGTIMKKRRSVLAFLGAITLVGTLAHGSGFAILEQSPRGLGTSFAGMAAKIDDPGSLYYNPAVSAWFKESQVMLGLHVLRTNVTFSDDGSTNFDGTPIEGDNGGNAGGYSLIPNNYMIFPIAEDWAFGLGITATSGTATEWGWGWVGRYQAIKTAASTIDISPSLSWMVTEKLSIGAGLNIQYMQLEKINAVDGYQVLHHVISEQVATANPSLTPAQVAAIADSMVQSSPYLLSAGAGSGAYDTILEVNEDSLALGWNVGLLYEPTQGTRLGFSYRSRISHSPEGDAEMDTANPMLAAIYRANNILVDTDTESDMDLPPMFIFGLYQRLNEQWALLVDVEHTMWSSIDKITTIFDSAQPDHITRFEWEDTWRVALGFEWYYSEAFTFRFGGAWDQAPCKEEDFRTPRMPDVDRYWASLGLTYKITENLDLDLAYMHLFMDKGNASYVDENTHQTLNGTYVGSADLFSFGVIWKY